MYADAYVGSSGGIWNLGFWGILVKAPPDKYDLLKRTHMLMIWGIFFLVLFCFDLSVYFYVANTAG